MNAAVRARLNLGFWRGYRLGLGPADDRSTATNVRETKSGGRAGIGEPAAVLQAVEESDLRTIASIGSTPLSGPLVGPEIKLPEEMRGQRVGGAGGGNRK